MLSYFQSIRSCCTKFVKNNKSRIILSENKCDSKRRVLSLYKGWYRQMPYIVRQYDVPKSVDQCRKKMREKFLENAHLEDIRLIDMMVVKGQMELKEALNHWKQRSHIMLYFKDTVERKPTRFIDRFLSGKIGEITIMSLKTLLDAAAFIELQEQQLAAEFAKSSPSVSSTPPPAAQPSPPQQQTVVISPPPPRIVLNSGSSSSSSTSTATTNGAQHHQTVLITTSESLLTLAQQSLKKETQQQQSNSSAARPTPPAPRRYLHNSFDIMNPLVIDETGTAQEVKRKLPPMVFRAGTREVHNKLEKHRRAHLKECFDVLKKQLPASQDEKKTSNLSILHSALRCIQSLKRKERELEHEMERLARDKIAAQQRLAVLKKDISSHYDNVDFSKILPETTSPATTLVAASTAAILTPDEIKIEIEEHPPTINNNNNNNCPAAVVENNNGRIQVPILPSTKTQIAIATTQVGTIKTEPVQTTALSVVPVGYPVSQGLVLQKLAIVPKGLTDLSPLVSTHFITQQQINGKVVPLVNAQYVVKPVVVVSRPS